jgi:hypothetical protein
MSWWGWFLVSFGLLVLVWVVAVCALVVAGRRTDARALGGFIRDCLLLMRRLLADPRVPRRLELVLRAAGVRDRSSEHSKRSRD